MNISHVRHKGTKAQRQTVLALLLCLMAFLASGSSALAQMPDMKQMSGIPRPVDDLPNGSVSVRVIKGDMSHNIANQPVELHSGGKVDTKNTDAEGRAQFDNLVPGTAVKFATVVDGERLESQEFPVQPQGGVRLLLVATDAEAAKEAAAEANAPAVAGSVVIAGESRIVVEPNDETVSVFYILDIVNNATSPVNPDRPFAFTLPAAAVNTTVMQGSTPLASAKGREVSVAGPFPPGMTLLQVAAEYPTGNGTVAIAQAFPATVQQPVVIAKKTGNMRLASPQFERSEESVVEGTPVIFGLGRTLDAGQTMTVTISGLPYRSSVPRNSALLIAGVIVVIGVWAASKASGAAADQTSERQRLIARRERLFQDLVRLEHDRRKGRVPDARYGARREELIQALEHVYGALDEDGAGPEPAKRTGVAA
jgi:hypothetical protein